MIPCVVLDLIRPIRDRWSRTPALIVALAVAAGLLAPATGRAATLTWWATGSTGSAGGAGTWNTSGLNWTSDGVTWSAWSNPTAPPDTAVFGGTAGTVTLSTGITVGGLTFDTTGYTITGNTLTLAGGTANVTLSSGVGTIASTVSGTSLFAKLGSGTLTLSSANNYSGGTIVSAGRIVLGNNAALGTSTVTLDGGSIERNAIGTVANAIAMGAGGGTILGRQTVDDYTTLSGQLSGSGGLTIIGLVNLSGTGSTYSGPITLTGGNTTFLRFSSASAVAPTASIQTTTSGKIRIDGVTVEVASLTSNGEVFNNGTGTVGRLRVGSGTMSGLVYNGSGQLAIEKVSSGTLTISGGNTYSGGTTVTAGRIVLGNNAALGTGTITLDGGSIERNAVGTVTNAIAVGAGGGTIVGRQVIDDYTALSGQLTGSGPLTTQGLVLLNNASNTYSGTLAISNASSSYLALAASEVLGDTAVISFGGTNSFLRLNAGVTETIGGLAGSAGNVFVAGSGTSRLRVASSGTYGGTFTNSGNSLVFEKAGSGMQVLNRAAGNAAAIAGVEVTGGTLRLSGSSVSFNTGYFTGGQPITIRSGATLEVAGDWNTAPTNLITVDGGTLSMTNRTLADSSNYVNNLTLMNGATVTGNAVRSGFTSHVIISSTGSATNTFSAGMNLVNASGFTTTFAVDSGTLAMSGAIADFSGFAGMPVIKSGAGTLVISSSNTYTGPTVINEGVVAFAANALGSSGTITINGGGLRWATGNTQDISSRLALVSGSTATLDTNGNNVTLATGFGGSTSASLVKAGPGTLTLAGINTYTGATDVLAGGTLAVNGSLANAGLNVASGATLMGSGTIAGLTTLAGIHRPGNSPGVQTFANLTYNAGASVQWELWNNTTANSPTAYDQIVVNGDLTFSGATVLDLVFTGSAGPTSLSSVAWSNPFWDSNQEWLLYNVAGTLTNANNLTLAVANWQDSTGAFFQTARPNSTFSVEQRANDIYIVYAAVPEPATAVLAVIGLAAVVVLRRRGRLG